MSEDTLAQQPQQLQLGIPGTLTATGWQPPDELAYDDWQALLTKFCTMQDAIQWWIGDAIAFGERKYGEMYERALEETGYSYQSLRNMATVSRAVELSRRRDNLSWSHHETIAVLEPREQEEWLAEAEAEGLTRNQVRKAIQKEQRQAQQPQLPEGIFSVFYADPPWQYRNSDLKGGAEDHYDTLPTEDICRLPIGELAADNAVLFLWVTNPLLPDGMQVMEAWGFDYKTNFAWLKDRKLYGKLGFYNYGRHELLFIGTRGSFLPVDDALKSSVVEAAKREHSRKPAVVYEYIEAMYPNGKYIELFSRTEREGWRMWGKEAADGEDRSE